MPGESRHLAGLFTPALLVLSIDREADARELRRRGFRITSMWEIADSLTKTTWRRC